MPISRGGGGFGPPAMPAPVAPTLTSATIPTGGTTITLLFSAAVSTGAGGNAGWTISMSGGAATLSYSSGSGTTSLVYSISRTVESGETGTVGYTQPGNGIEATSGGIDVATIGSSAVTNNSTQSGGGSDRTWNQVTGNAGYRVIWDDATHATASGSIAEIEALYPDSDDTATDVNSYAIPGSGTIYWRVAALVNGYPQQWSDEASFSA